MPDRFRRLHLLVEGQTEEVVVAEVLRPHLERAGWAVTFSIVTTRRAVGGPARRGGLTTWAKLEREIRLLLRDSSIDVLTTLVDFYGLPEECPGMSDRPAHDAYERVAHVEAAMAAAIGDHRFRPNVVLHEIEAWVFAAGVQLAELRGEPGLALKLAAEVGQAGGPELINDGPATAPSKRLIGHCPGYAKTVEGPLAVTALGIDALRALCPHVDTWLLGLDA
ncbi:DUF4276 family protein [Actinokineospora globicatena]|uniref:DUF4276 family protein n=1 Tax=Actinokineospora globicatena TaxID=103729 RepID=UPI0020A4FFDD|nr:DUF4276 family protein [Actinokineospora globicatena]MCP2300437.1 protein of unknown function (DUF4276) [Actinokineospora globicatena]GLW80970.1 hypothetical protein Aglo01_54510 [Actinokineospora globicatena]GLW88163.1 hypothetical protein Aglo02_58020 [Actinokineospora globicatena]